MAFTLVTITADELRPDGQPASGTLSATLSGQIQNGTETVAPTTIAGILAAGSLYDSSGVRPYQLVAVDDVGTMPAAPTAVYDFVIQLGNAPVVTFSAAVSATAPLVNGIPTIDLSVLSAPWGPAPSSLVTSRSSGYVSLRQDFALNPSMGASALQTKIQNAITSAISARMGLDFGAELWPIDGEALAVGDSLSFLAAGAQEVAGGTVANGGGNMPGAAPWVRGGGLVQEAAGAHILDFSSAVGPTPHFRDMVFAFGGSSAFNNTGSHIYGIPSTAYSTGLEQGFWGSHIENCVFFAHDGSHWALDLTNFIYCYFEHVRSYGGGLWRLQTNSASTSYGNTTTQGCTGIVLANGTADGVNQSGNGVTFPGQLNSVKHYAVQVNIISPAGKPLASAFTIPVPAGGQYVWNDGNGLSFCETDLPDLESQAGLTLGKKFSINNRVRNLYAPVSGSYLGTAAPRYTTPTCAANLAILGSTGGSAALHTPGSTPINDDHGQIQLVTGSNVSGSHGKVCDITYGIARLQTPLIVQLQAFGYAEAAAGFFVTNLSTTGFSVYCTNPLPASTTMVISYNVIE